jgi:peptidyl-dipeptidase A
MSRSRRLGVAALGAAAVVSLATGPAGAQTAKKPSTPATAQTAKKPAAPAKKTSAKPTAAEAQKFVEAAESQLLALAIEQQRADWVKSTFITDDTEAMAALANQRLIDANVEYAKQATRFDGVNVAPDVRRKLGLIKLAITLPAPSDPRKSAELTQIVARMEGTYGKGKWQRKTGAGKDETLDIVALTRLMADSRDEKELRAAWAGWHAIAPPIRADYMRYVELGNEGARELGFPDMGAMWRAKYDMPPDAFAAEVDRLWKQVEPLYLSLHAYVRRRLRETYGPDVVPEKGPIPAHLLGNMWAQEWGNIYKLVAPKDADSGIDLTARLRAKNVDPRGMVRYGEGFFTSLGFAPLPATFWERSMFTKPADRDVVCHASAWDVDFESDLRIKMCIDITGEDFRTIHHELGHNFYQRAYAGQPFLFRDSANDGFHEAIGDAIALSVTPSYLRQLGLIDTEPDPSKDIGLLLQQALDKVAFLPFGLLIDQWRWKLFSGEITPANANAEWWKLRLKYQGVAPPVARSEADFDPGAKYHVPANVSYTRYFLARILQFQFHRAMCKAAGRTGPLYRASVYGDKVAGQKLEQMLAMGLSQPWPDALEALTGERQMDATAILDYFAPLQKWLDEQNAGQPIGW